MPRRSPAIDWQAIEEAREARPACVLRLVNGWTISIAPEPQEGALYRRCIAAWPTGDDNKETTRFHEFKSGRDRVWSIDDLIEFLHEVVDLPPPEREEV